MAKLKSNERTYIPIHKDTKKKLRQLCDRENQTYSEMIEYLIGEFSILTV